MDARRGWHLCLIAAPLLLTDCAGSDGPRSPTESAHTPPNYREVVAAKVRETFFDPYSIRDASISAPFPGTSILGTVETVCVRANAKNRVGAYIGIKATSFTFRAGQLQASDPEYATMTCAQAVYGPFPEIDSATPSAKAKR